MLALFAVILPVLLALAGLVLDGGDLLNEYRLAQHAVDAAASAAARSLYLGATESEAAALAEQYVQEHNGLSDAEVTVSIPPLSGPLTGDADSVEVEVHQPAPGHFLSFLGGGSTPNVRTRAVARHEPVTSGAALVVLDPDPPPLSLPVVSGLLPPLPSLLGGLEVLGSRVRVDGAIHVNTAWGGEDEKGNPAGESPPPPFAVSCPGASILGQLQARDIRVVGGVDSAASYGHFVGGEPNPLRANRLPVPDPLIDLPVPTLASDPSNVVDVNHGSVTIADPPLLAPLRTLEPGVYDWIQIVSGRVEFAPGIYIIRGAHPVTGISLNILGGEITGDGVMFYLTDTSTYSPASGAPDNADGQTQPPPPAVPTLLPSTVIILELLSSELRGLEDPGSPFDGMLLFQRRTDRRPIVLIAGLVLGTSDVEGTLYAKWGHVLLAGQGFTNTRTVAGTLRLLSVWQSTIAPDNLFPPAEDVFLVE